MRPALAARRPHGPTASPAPAFPPPRRLLIALCFGALSWTAAAPADEPPPPKDTTELEALVVVGTSSAREVRRLPYSVYTLGPEDLKLRLAAPSLPEALAETPSVMLQKTGVGMVSPYVRGFTGQRTVLLVDGIRLNNSFLREGPNQYWSLVDGYWYDRLEVLLGPASMLYGSDAVGGVVLAESAPLVRGAADRGATWQGGELYTRYASAERSFSEHVDGAVALADRWSLRLGATRQDFGDLVSGEHTENEKTDYSQWGENLRARRWFSDDASVLFGYDHFAQDDIDRVHQTVDAADFHGTASKGGATDRRRTFAHDRQMAFSRYELRNGDGWLEEMDAGVSYQYMREHYRRVRSDGRLELRDDRIDTLGANLRLRSPSPAGTWTYGVDASRDFVATAGHNVSPAGVRTERIQGDVADDATYDLVGVYLQNELPLGERCEVLSGLRYDYARQDAGVVNFNGVAGPLTGEWDAVTASGRVLHRLLPHDRLNVYAGVSQAFRAPNLSDTTRDGDFVGGTEVPTAGLNPEYFTTYELGAKTGGHWGSVSAAVYHTDIRDLIVRFENPTPGKRNVEHAEMDGAELATELRFSETWRFLGNVAWQYGRHDGFTNRDVRMPDDDQPLSRLAPLTAHLAVRYAPPPGRWWAEVASDLAGRQDRLMATDETDNRNPPDGTPGYQVFHLRGGYRPTPKLEFTVGLENLFDQAYRIHGSGVNEPGRNLVVAARWRF